MLKWWEFEILYQAFWSIQFIQYKQGQCVIMLVLEYACVHLQIEMNIVC